MWSTPPPFSPYWLLWLWVATLPLAASPLPVPGKLDLAGQLEVLLDPEGQWDIAEVAAGRAGPFSPLPQPLLTGITPGAVWLRLGLEPDSQSPPEAWLEVAPATLEDVRLYTPLAAGGFRERRSGQAWPWGEREVDYRQPLFRLALAPGPNTFYLRLQSRAPLKPELTLWPPLAFTEAAMAEARVWGLYFGIYALVVLFHSLFWMWTQERLQYLYSLYVSMNLLVILLASGWLQQAQPGFWIPGLANATMGALTCLSLPVMQGFILVYAAIPAGPGSPGRALVGAANLLAALGLALVLTGHYGLAMSLAQPASLVFILVSMALAAPPAWRGNERTRLFLLAFGLYGLGLAVSLARNQGWIGPGLVTDNSYAIGALTQALVMSLAIFADHKRLRREKAEAETRAAAERRLREEQEDFLALVSHEVRTPLSIIDAAAHNLVLDPALHAKARARGEKIRRASRRLARLMDDYLSAERLASADQPLHRVPHDLEHICRAALDDLEGTPGPEILLETRPLPPCPCDADLIRLAIRNLLQNARRHAPPASPIQLRLEEAGRGIVIQVQDAGAGVPAADLPVIFKRFRRGHNTAEPGAGLGLYLVDKVARRHGGSVGVVNLAGGGCEFSLWLPLADPGDAD